MDNRYSCILYRHDNCLKNKFYGEVGKILRLLNKLSVKVLKKRSKPLKYGSLVRVFNIAQDGGKWDEEIRSLAYELREILFRLILSLGKKDIENIGKIMDKILEFNVKTKHHAILKKKNSESKSNHPEYNGS